MKNVHDVIVIGLGVMGASTLWRAAQKCTKVLGIDAAGPTHCYGSSHGESRIFRRDYWEGEQYLPLLNHADFLWHELAQSTDKKILFHTGGIFIGPKSSSIVDGSIKTANRGGIDHEVLTSSNIRGFLPAFNVHDGMHAVYEPGAYAISARDSRLEMMNEAVRHGARIEFGDTVVCLENHEAGVRATTKRGCTHYAKSVIVTTGPWMTNNLMKELTEHLEPRQVPIYWFSPKANSGRHFLKENFPVFLYEFENGDILYGVPSISSSEPGVKIGFHNRKQTPANADWKNTPIQQKHITEISEAITSIFPKLESLPTHVKSCFYTMSTDESFLIGKSKTLKKAYFASACSGHGYKFAPAIGDALANMAVGQKPCFSLSAFSVDRFNST